MLIASFLYFAGEGVFGTAKSVFGPIIMLMLLVFSAALTGSLVFGKPVMLYLDNKKKDALFTLVYTLIILLMLTILMFLLFITLNSQYGIYLIYTINI